MKSIVVVWLSLLVGCSATSHGNTVPIGDRPSDGALAGLDDVPTGSTCDASAPDLAETFAPAVGVDGTDAIAKDDARIVGWASKVFDVDYGEGVAERWKAEERAIGAAEGTSTDVVSLGEGGAITLGFDAPLVDGEGSDFCVFENSFSDDFLELGFVEVASHAEVFVRFPVYSRVATTVDAYGTLKADLVEGFAGKYRQGYCTPFDLAALKDRAEVLSGALDLSAVRYVRIRDVVGNGETLDCSSKPIFDPYPTTGGAGFDLDAIAVLGSNE